MSLGKYFKPANALPTHKESGLSMHATTEVNKAVERALQRETEAKSTGRKRKCMSTFSKSEQQSGSMLLRMGMPRQVESMVSEKAQFDCSSLVVAIRAVLSKSKSTLLIPDCMYMYIYIQICILLTAIIKLTLQKWQNCNLYTPQSFPDIR